MTSNPNTQPTQGMTEGDRDKFADAELTKLMEGIGFELRHHEDIADWFVKDEGTSELTVFGAREMMQLILADRETAYAQGVSDALFRPEEHTPGEIADRNARIVKFQPHQTTNTKEEE